MSEICKHGNSAPLDIIRSLPNYQAGTGRHKCAICAYELAKKNGTSPFPVEYEECLHGYSAPKHLIASLSENQGGIGRHKCVICAYHFAQVDLGSLKPDVVVDIEKIELMEDLPATEKAALVLARLGQGKFRQNLLTVESACRVTGLSNPSFLIASHIKPWRFCNNMERLDKNNGLMLSPHIDKLFDTGNISFSDDGSILHSTSAREALEKWSCDLQKNTGLFNERQRTYLAWHRTQYKDILES